MSSLYLKKNRIFLLLILGFLWTLPVQAHHSSNFWSKLYRELQGKKDNPNWRDRLVQRGNKYYYLNRQGEITEHYGRPSESPMGENEDLGSVDNSGEELSDTEGSKGNKRTLKIPGLGDIAYSQEAINAYYKELKKNPSEIIVDTPNGIAFYMDENNKFQIKSLNDVRHMIHPLDKGQAFDFPRGSEAPEVIPERPQTPRDMVCRDVKKKKQPKFLGRKNIMAASAQLTVITPHGRGSYSAENCNAWKVSGNQIMTNAHCIESLIRKPSGGCEYNKRECTRRLRRKIGKATNKKIKAKFYVNGRARTAICGVLQAANRSLDYAVLKCRNLPKQVPVVRMAKKRPSRKTQMTLATWDFKNGGVRKRKGRGRVIGKFGTDLRTNIQIKSGNSGSVLYNSKTLEAVGLIHSKDAAGTYNNGYFTSAADIMKDMKRTAPKIAKRIRSASEVSKVKCTPATAKDLFIGNRDEALPTSVAN